MTAARLAMEEYEGQPLEMLGVPMTVVSRIEGDDASEVAGWMQAGEIYVATHRGDDAIGVRTVYATIHDELSNAVLDAFGAQAFARD